MEYLKKLLFNFCSQKKVSGCENEFACILKKELEQFSKKITISSNNSVIAKIENLKNSQKPDIILTAHLDAIGFMVNEICENGFLRIKNCGGINLKIASNQKVVVHGKEKIVGNTLLKKTGETENLFVDVGLSKPKIEKLVRLGDRVNFYFNFLELNKNKICSKNLDDCAGVATIFLVLNKLNNKKINRNLTIIFSSQEETTGAGLITASYDLNAEFAICVDVSFAKFLGCNDNSLGSMGNGPMIGISPVLDAKLSEKLQNLAKINKIPFQLEIMNSLTSTDADQIIKLKNGIKACLCSIPLRYMHSPVEIIDLNDIKQTANLILALLESIY